MTTDTAAAPAWIVDLFGAPALVERPGTYLLSRLVRAISVDDLRAAVTATAAKMALRIPGLDVVVYEDPAGELEWCATHRAFGCDRDKPSEHNPYPAACYKALAHAVDVEVRAEGLPMDGEWSVGGVLTRDAAGAVIAASVGDQRDDEMFARRLDHLMGECVHCGLARRRNVTVLLISAVTGEVRPVGRSCLAEYTGGAIRVEALSSLIGLAERFATEVGGVLEAMADTAPVVDIVALAMRYITIGGGFVPASAGGTKSPTSWDVRAALTWRDGKAPAVTASDLTAADRAAAAAAIALVLDESLDTGRDQGSSFLANLREVASLDWAQITGPRQRVGLLAALPGAAERRVSRPLITAPGRVNAHIGEEKQRREFTGKLVSNQWIDTEFGGKDLVIIDTAEGTVKVFGTCRDADTYDVGDTLTLTGTIAEHAEFKGHRQTRIVRVKLAPKA